MKLLKNFLRSSVCAALTLMVAVLSAHAEETPLGVVDTTYVLHNYEFVESSQVKLQKSRERFQRLIETADDELKKKNKDDDKETFENRRKAVQRVIDQELMKLHNDQKDMQTLLDNKFDAALETARISRKKS